VRILLSLNSWSGFQVASSLRHRGETIVGLVLHPVERRFDEEILSALQMPADRMWLSSQLRDQATLTQLGALEL
jgi:methionyl-tRNA formyltransferase